ncbi:hypothetical protein K227x_27600 [Rubripirellula lacrimiformis]|uniref:Uncharacterized protein n=1 Tax=Rubripirellula lacrimiformis TaxID=1930273 RepID=A0A517NB53_9BACT|nr:hypothetical protein K227x_27600 [Rubripirellula lacrimiformis]
MGKVKERFTPERAAKIVPDYQVAVVHRDAVAVGPVAGGPGRWGPGAYRESTNERDSTSVSHPDVLGDAADVRGVPA